MSNTIAEQLKNEDLTLEQKLALIDKQMNDTDVKAAFNKANGRAADTPLDPMDALMCEGCQ